MKYGVFYEFAELSFDQESRTDGKYTCDLTLFTARHDDPDMGETHYDELWVAVLERLGHDGWMVGGVMDYSAGLRAILLQRPIVPEQAS